MILNADRTKLAQDAIQRALQTRSAASIPILAPALAFDVCEQMGLAVWFSDIPSMEGLYLPDARPKPAVVVSAVRPRGRQSMTCAHELGHHIYQDGEQWDELVNQRNKSRRFDPIEYRVDMFSASFHMPKLAVCHATKNREIDVAVCPPQKLYELSAWFGVGYSALIYHLARTLRLIPESRAKELLKVKPRDIRHQILGRPCPNVLVVADHNWTYRPIDLQIGDVAILPRDAELEGKCIARVVKSSQQLIVQAVSPGIGRVSSHSHDWTSYIRVSRKDYVGRASFRFDEEVEHNG